MGGGVWDPDAYRKQQKTRRDKGQTDFAYSDSTRARPADEWQVNPLLDPRGINGVRESRDNDEHPETRAIAVFFDVTGSMGIYPGIIQRNLVNLMDLIKVKCGIEHPQLLTGAVGDTRGGNWELFLGADRVPFQISQFESDNRIDEQIRSIFLESGGKGQKREAYGLAYYAAAFKTDIDCWNKRRQKGYLFVIGDEMPWPEVEREEILTVFGDAVERGYTMEELVAKTAERYDVFHILPMGLSYSNDPEIEERWRELLGEQVLRLEDPEGVCQLIADTIAARENTAAPPGKPTASTRSSAGKKNKSKPPEDKKQSADDNWRL